MRLLLLCFFITAMGCNLPSGGGGKKPGSSDKSKSAESDSSKKSAESDPSKKGPEPTGKQAETTEKDYFSALAKGEFDLALKMLQADSSLAKKLQKGKSSLVHILDTQ